MARAQDDLPRLTLEQFLEFDDGSDTLYELHDGWLQAMNPPRPGHGVVMSNIVSTWKAASPDPKSCRPAVTPGIVFDPKKPDYYIPDVAFTCEQFDDTAYLREPIAVAEVLSPSTERDDFGLKLARYQGLSSLREIWLIGSRERWVQIYTLVDGRWVPSLPVTGTGVVQSALFGEIELESIYEGSDVPEGPPPRRRHRLPPD